MKKFLLKGKQLLSKKLQQFDIQTPQINYVLQQTPTRLKQSLEVLRQNQIDLEDSHDYQTYFKNYPNHHLSHYLLDKFKANLKEIEEKYKDIKDKEEGESMSNSVKYALPQNPNKYIPVYDQKLEQKAIAFKQSIQQYEQGYNKTQQPLVCICVIHFHHKRGTEVQYKYPSNSKFEAVYNNIVHHAMPDSSHLRDEDCNFFNFESDCLGRKKMMFGVSYFKQIKTTHEMKQNNVELTRSHVQKAISVISILPIFQYLKLRLKNATQVFFENFSNFQIVKEVYENINYSLIQSWPNIQLPDLYMGCNLRKIVTNFGVNGLFDIWKALIYQKRVVVFAQTSSDASSFILSLLSLFPGLSTFGVCSKPISRYLQSLRQYALPLRIFSSQNILSISFHVQDFWQLAKFVKNEEGNFLLGTTNRLLKQSNQYGIEMLVNLQDSTVLKSNKTRRPWQALTKKEKNFISDLRDMLQNADDMDNPQIQDMIRNSFHDFLKNSLTTMISGIKQYQNFITECAKYEKLLKKAQKAEKKQATKHSSYQFMEDQQQNADHQDTKQVAGQYAPTFPQKTNQIIFPQLLLNKSFTYFRQFHNSNLPQIIHGKILPSIYINNYEYLIRLSQEEFISYNWLQKKLIFGKGKPQNFDGKEIRYKVSPSLETLKSENNLDIIRSIYIGLVQNGKYTKHGFYIDKSEHYEGEFQNGMKHGYGKYSNQNEKYIGDFKNNLYDGEGQLVKDGDIYVGSFRQGLRHGFGSIQGNSESFVGEWKFDKPVKQGSKSLEDFENDQKAKQREVTKQKQKRKSSAHYSKKS